MAKQLKQSSTGLCPEVFDVPSTSGQNCVSEEFSSDCLLADSQLHASSEGKLEISASEEGDIPYDWSPHVTLRSSYSVNLESLDNIIADEHYKKVNVLYFPFKSESILTVNVVLSENNLYMLIRGGTNANSMID